MLQVAIRGLLYCFRWRSEGGAGGRAESPQCARRRKPLPRWGLTRRLRRGLGFAVPRGAHTFLSVAKEKCAKESQRHGDSCGPPRYASRASVCGSPFGAVLVLGSLRSPAGKKASTAHFDGGARYVARSTLGLPTWTFVRARAHSNPLSKRARLFPSAAYRRSAPPQLAVGRLTPCGLGWFPVGWPILEGHRPAGSAGASHEACRRMAVCTRQAAGSRTRLASREACRRAAVASRPSRESRGTALPRAARACRRAAVASRPNRMSPSTLRAHGAQSGVKGHCPCPRAARPVAKRR